MHMVLLFSYHISDVTRPLMWVKSGATRLLVQDINKGNRIFCRWPGLVMQKVFPHHDVIRSVWVDSLAMGYLLYNCPRPANSNGYWQKTNCTKPQENTKSANKCVLHCISYHNDEGDYISYSLIFRITVPLFETITVYLEGSATQWFTYK